MYGKNKVYSQDLSSPNVLNVHETFPTIQGEGPLAGHAAWFIRLSHCSLRCYFCDTAFDQVKPTPVEELVAQAIEWRKQSPYANLVVITGGEPFIQNLQELLWQLSRAHFHVQIETAGTHWLIEKGGTYLHRPVITTGSDWVGMPGLVSIVCSPKTPKINDDIADAAICFKYIVAPDDSDPEDGLPIMSTQKLGKSARLFRPKAVLSSGYRKMFSRPVYVQPRDDGENVASTQANLAHAVALVQKYGYRLSIQQHKIINLP